MSAASQPQQEMNLPVKDNCRGSLPGAASKSKQSTPCAPPKEIKLHPQGDERIHCRAVLTQVLSWEWGK